MSRSPSYRMEMYVRVTVHHSNSNLSSDAAETNCSRVQYQQQLRQEEEESRKEKASRVRIVCDNRIADSVAWQRNDRALANSLEQCITVSS